ncbi:MAG: SRPBCC family protein [Gemmatimonadota bacterium]|jgi:ribosome-associated toxin RatA of RatAB toxin-antitoxin module
MLRIDERVVRAGPERCFLVAADVERWPELLPHYRHVQFHRKDAFGCGRVEMAAWRYFGPLRYPTWWVSDMESDRVEPIVRYRHVDGITRGMDVRWEFLPHPGGSRVRIVHEWVGPAWPVVGTFAADYVIGPGFVSAIAQRTLAGVGAQAERLERNARPRETRDARAGDNAEGRT